MLEKEIALVTGASRGIGRAIGRAGGQTLAGIEQDRENGHRRGGAGAGPFISIYVACKSTTYTADAGQTQRPGVIAARRRPRFRASAPVP